MQRISLSPNLTMSAALQDDDDDFGTFLAYSPTIASLARSFGYVPPTLLLPSPSSFLSPLADTPPHLRNIASAGVGLASIPPQPPSRRVASYTGSPPTGPLLSSTPMSSPYSSQRFSDGSPPSIGAAGVGLFTPSPAPSPPQQERNIAAVTETRTVTTTYKGNKHPPRVTRVSTRQTSP